MLQIDYEEKQQPVTPCQPSNATTDAGTHAYIIGGLSQNVTDNQSFIYLCAQLSRQAMADAS